jgi:hypothetical protein
MLINANLPHKYWGEAAVAAAYITNRMPTARLSGQIDQQDEWVDITETPKSTEHSAEPEEKNGEQLPAYPEEEGHHDHHHLDHLLEDELLAPRTRRPPDRLEDYSGLAQRKRAGPITCRIYVLLG